MNGDLFPAKQAYGEYLGRFYAGLYPDTPAMSEFVERGLAKSVVWAADRMVDQVEDMLKSYQKNSNSGVPGANALFPVIVVGMSKDYIPTGGDFGGRQVGRRLVKLTDAEDASVYGYRQGMGDIRTQVVIMAAESATARSLAAQFSLFVGEIPNRRFTVLHQWGQYTLGIPCMIETPDIAFQKIDVDSQNMTVLATDITLKVVIPYLDAPKPGDENDGSANNPPGYPVVGQINVLDENQNVYAEVDDTGITYTDPPEG